MYANIKHYGITYTAKKIEHIEDNNFYHTYDKNKTNMAKNIRHMTDNITRMTENIIYTTESITYYYME